LTDLYGLRKYEKYQIAVLVSLRRRIQLAVVAPAELISVCFVWIPEISSLQRSSRLP